MRRLGIMHIWGREDFVEPAVRQDLEMPIVDVLAVSTECLHPYVRRYEDGSEEIVMELLEQYPGQIVHVPLMLDSGVWKNNICDAYTQMLEALNPEEGDVIWELPVDEFYFRETVRELTDFAHDHPDFVSLRFHQRIIGPDMDHFIQTKVTRIHRYFRGRYFAPATFFVPCEETFVELSIPGYSYQLARGWCYLAEQWTAEAGDFAKKKARWAEYVFTAYDPSDEERGKQLNKEHTGVYGYWPTGEDGNSLSSDTGPHPEFIESSEFRKRVYDFRKAYQPFRARIPLTKLKGRSGLHIAEVGVQKGHHACGICHDLAPERLYLVDPYKAFQGRGGPTPQVVVDLWEREAHRRLAPFGDSIVWIKKTSVEASREFDDESLDAVYIDDNHLEEYVRASIQVWWPKVKPGGILCGHDYYQNEPGVILAVNEFAERNGLKLETD